jgi:hypothetical protein
MSRDDARGLARLEHRIFDELEAVAADVTERVAELGNGLGVDDLLLALEPMLTHYVRLWHAWQLVSLAHHAAEHPDDEGDAGRNRTAEVLRQRALDREWEVLTRQLRDQPTTD